MLSDMDKRLLELNLTHTPRYPNGCDHKDEDYVGTAPYFRIQDKEYKEEWIDVYVFDDCGLGQLICIRYGARDHEYYSPGPFTNFLQRSHTTNAAYAKALEILFYHGTIKYIRY